jgi:hypothetical protein
MLDDIFANNENRLKNLRTRYNANTVASMVNDRLEDKGIDDRVTGAEIDGFLKISRLGKEIALVPIIAYKDAMMLEGLPV